MILEGTKNDGGSKVALYQDYEVFKNARDEAFDGTAGNWSQKACSFDDLAAAKNYIQMARDEEGVHWDWPQEIPVFWKNGPITEADVSLCPAFEEASWYRLEEE